jgi:membrane-bound serine protease (ClpP class)
MIGEIGTAHTPLCPNGKIFVHGELWDATASSPVPLGGRVAVTSIEGLWLGVDPVSE